MRASKSQETNPALIAIKSHLEHIPFAIKSHLNEERGFGGGQPAGLAAASAWGRPPPPAGGGPTKLPSVFGNSLPQIGISSQERP